MSKYAHFSKEELVRLLEARDRRDATRFGLVWEADEIERDRALNSDFVALDLDPTLSVGTAPWENLVIEGDNFDALRHLRMCYAGRVKCIYIDPPYNTGNRDFVYNDRFVDVNDAWRHSTWCEFMYQRLTLAKDLLRQDGVIFIHIGEDEIHHLACFMDRIMPSRKVTTFVWRTRNGAMDSKEYFRSIDHEYILCYANPSFSFSGNAKECEDYENPDNDPRGDWVSADLTSPKNYQERENTYYPIQNPETGVWYPCNPNRVWAYATEARVQSGEKLRSETMEAMIRNKKILWPDEPNPAFYVTQKELLASLQAGAAPKNLHPKLPDLDFWVGKKIGWNMPRRKKFKTELKTDARPLSSWIVPSAEKEEVRALINKENCVRHLQTQGTSSGTALLRQILPDIAFSFPKPLGLVQELLKQIANPGDLVLDFFAGSGTTAHAVLKLNAEDNGNRRFILVSNTEATEGEPDKNLCRDVCARRVRRVIEGYGDTPGLDGNFAYLRCRRISPERLMDIDHVQVWNALQLLHTGTLMPYDDARGFLWAGDRHEAIAYAPHTAPKNLAPLRTAIKTTAAVTLYSWQADTLRHRLRSPKVHHLPIPEELALKFGLRK